jgi:hypothetical protein
MVDVDASDEATAVESILDAALDAVPDLIREPITALVGS